MTVGLAGYSAAAFGASEQAAFQAGVASVAETTPSAVTINSVTDNVNVTNGRRRGLLQGAGQDQIHVGLTVEVYGEASASAVASALGTAVEGDNFTGTLQSNGLDGVVGAVVVEAAMVFAPPPPPMARPLPAPPTHQTSSQQNRAGLVMVGSVPVTMPMMLGAWVVAVYGWQLFFTTKYDTTI